MRPRPRDQPEKKRPAAPAEATSHFSKASRPSKYSPNRSYIQLLNQAMLLDRHADALLFTGHHAAAERISNQAADLRAVAV